MLSDTVLRGFTHKYIEFITLLLSKNGYSNIQDYQKYITKYSGNDVYRTIDDIALQEIKEKCNTSNKGNQKNKSSE